MFGNFHRLRGLKNVAALEKRNVEEAGCGTGFLADRLGVGALSRLKVRLDRRNGGIGIG